MSKEIPQFVACGLEIGNCPRQISYDMVEHDKVIYQQGIEDERPKAFGKGYESGYQKGKEDALDHCEKCETEQWDALYKAEMKGRADVIEEMKKLILPLYCSCCNQIACYGGQVGSVQECASIELLRNVVFDLAEELKEQKK